MKNILLLVLVMATFILGCQKAEQKDFSQNFITTDIDNFWKAFDKIRSTNDSLEQKKYLETLFLEPASAGQKAMIAARRYKADEYIKAINDYPLFWESIRENTLKTDEYADEISEGIGKLNQMYPLRNSGNVYFTMGVFRSSGTTMDSLVLIGSEFAFGDENTVTTEFPEEMNYVKDYCQTNPIHDLTFLNVHEFVHTQQNSAINSNLINQCIREGVAEFVAVKATQTASPNASIHYGKKNDGKIKKIFEKQMFNQRYGYWLWSSLENEFNMRDLGYYIGYVIAEKYYDKEKDKEKAIQHLIELDFENEAEIENLINQANYFSKPVEELKKDYEASFPKVIKVREFDNGSQKVSSDLKQITIEFSKVMDDRFKSTDLGELGADHCPKFNSINFSDDGKFVTYDLKKLSANKKYQMIIGSSYRTKEGGMRLEPYLIEFKTGK